MIFRSVLSSNNVPKYLGIILTSKSTINTMKVNHIVANIETTDLDKADFFYQDVLGLDRVMDLGWIRTFSSSSKMSVQISFASEGGSGTPVPRFVNRGRQY
jgi:catechol-2,3-dioxygenase